MVPLPPRLRFILRRSVQIAEGLEAARALRAGPACCAPPGGELLLSRASRSRGLTLCGGLSLWARPRKAQIAKNNIALDGEGENNRIAGGDAWWWRRRRYRPASAQRVTASVLTTDVVPPTFDRSRNAAPFLAFRLLPVIPAAPIISRPRF